MRRITVLVVMLVVVLAGSPASAQPATAGAQRVEGTFVTTLDPTSLTATPVGSRCLVTASGELAFVGDMVGTATAATTALVLASCDQVVTTTPGTFADVFTSDLAFTGTVDDTAVDADVRWLGRTRAGGAIRSVMVVGGTTAAGGHVRGVLQVDAADGAATAHQASRKRS